METVGPGWEKIKEWYWVSARRGDPDPVPHLQVIRPEPCGVCGSRIRFGKTAIKCCQCQLLLHTKCREQCPSLCVPRPHHHAWPREVRGAQQCLEASPCPHEALGLLALGCWASAHSGCRAVWWAQHRLALFSPGCAG